MKTILSLGALMLLGLSGCARPKDVVYTEVEKSAFRRLLDPRFLLPLDNQERVYGVLDGFLKKSQEGEKVYGIDFENYPETEATLYFDDGGLHGGGRAHFKKEGGHWIQESKVHNL